MAAIQTDPLSATSRVNVPGGERRVRPATRPKDVLTTGQVAKICRVTIRTVIKWFECGKIDGYKIPASKDRRIPREALRQFLRDNAMPYDAELFDARPRLLIADDDDSLVDVLRDVFVAGDEIDVLTATSGFEAGYITARNRPDLLLIDLDLGDTTALDVIANLDKNGRRGEMNIIIMTGVLGEDEVASLRASDHHVITKPFDIVELEQHIRRALRV